MPSLTASKATEAGSPASGPRTVRAPTRSPQVCSWSAAAARKVSAAPSTTLRPSATSTRASLPVVVVLPVPLTPTTSTTAGCCPRRSRSCTVRSRSGADQGQQFLAQQGAQFVRGAGTEHLDPLAQPLDEFLGGRDSDVCDEQGLLDLLPGFLVEVLPGQQGEQSLAEGVLRTGEPGTQPYQTALGRLGDFDLGNPTAPRRPAPPPW